MPKTLRCGHINEDYCYLPLEKVNCSKNCQIFLKCGHLCQEKCQLSCTVYCKIMVEKKLPCGHLKTMHCSGSIDKSACEKMVLKKWPDCQHNVLTKCLTDVEKTECPKKCEKILSDCEHICQGTCGKCRNGKSLFEICFFSN